MRRAGDGIRRLPSPLDSEKRPADKERQRYSSRSIPLAGIAITGPGKPKKVVCFDQTNFCQRGGNTLLVVDRLVDNDRGNRF
jgi:hypothetical protein